MWTLFQWGVLFFQHFIIVTCIFLHCFDAKILNERTDILFGESIFTATIFLHFQVSQHQKLIIETRNIAPNLPGDKKACTVGLYLGFHFYARDVFPKKIKWREGKVYSFASRHILPLERKRIMEESPGGKIRVVEFFFNAIRRRASSQNGMFLFTKKVKSNLPVEGGWVQFGPCANNFTIS